MLPQLFLICHYRGHDPKIKGAESFKFVFKAFDVTLKWCKV